MSNSRGGFFSLNRLLGRKNKNEKKFSNGLSKSSVQTLTRSTTNLEEISPQNKITPLATVHNAPFEQTFRITVYLPLQQLYVTRIGAKAKLSELLDMICTNKSLVADKYEFKHPTDDTQVFDLSFTIGEVGLNEIKLAHKSDNEKTSVKYRTNSSGHINRPIARPHTISSASPYSSTNSLNSYDSAGMTTNRLSADQLANRKKRIAPRPPSQNSIPENPEQKHIEHETTSQFDQSELNQNHLIRQNFHVSSPNLSVTNCTRLKSYSSNSSTDTSINSSLDGKQDVNYMKNAQKHQQSHLSNDDFEFQTSESNNLPYTQCHSRTSSDTSDINKDGNLSELQMRERKRPPIGKKKAPAPPPRTSFLSSNGSISTSRCALQKLSEEEIKDENGNVSAESQDVEVNQESVEPLKNGVNVSKVMLNVNETGYVSMENDISNNWENSTDIKNHNNTTIQVNYSAVEKPVETLTVQTKAKKVSIVDFTNPDPNHGEIEIDTNDVSQQVNEIIDEAVKINEEILNAKNSEQHNNKQSNEINNNNERNLDHTTYEKNKWAPKQKEIEIIEHLNSEHSKSNDIKTALVEVPIQPILHETRTFDFQEYGDNSLAVSSTSTTAETPSTGPNSLITSDIEDGYKGNDQRPKIESTCEESKEDFIESQFGFLSEHEHSEANSNENDDVDDEKCVQASGIISSTMISENDTFKESPSIVKKDVINELTQFINSNRLDAFIRPNNETNNADETSKRSSLSNFHIGAYANGNSNTSNSLTNNKQQSGNEDDVNHIPQITICDKEQSSETPAIPKPIGHQIGRSMSFHSTFPSVADHDENENGTSIVNGTSRSISYISLNGTTKPNNNNSSNETLNEFNKMSCKKSSSELSIADTPSLQSIEVMKSILNKSRTLNRDGVPCAQKKAINQENGKNNQRNFHENEVNQQTNDDMASSKMKTETKTWKYQGPPSVNLSTWGERPKSLVHIKNDEDYISGAPSKVVTSNGDRHNNVRPSEKPFQKSDEYCKNNSCKLPVVRSVEYKKNTLSNNQDSNHDDIPDSVQFRSNYKISRIVGQRPNSVCVPTTNLNQNSNENQNSDKIPREKSFPSVINRVQSFNGQHEAITKNRTNNSVGTNVISNRFSSNDTEKPIFSQFTLRKTGLKEKILDECNPSKKITVNHSSNHYKKIPVNEPKVNQIPTAPKPPPTLTKPKNRPVVDTRDELLNSIRSFNRDTLKRKCIY
ncbi:probable serine/threonine-protein kinase DDB_G0282963 isoform X2 [Contarinia nasturtii]|uniref:probable serine/threonine-protein kinase DDB_G0282963 isoform X2 n=1 Tax=Contarinia nasturtii TaxID=265458 RepID=UPI0012D3ABA1|nr:probable serine/threonine-protein kinase DDB_G0282963 isoform X2 [Contarinia nasturtii]